MSELRFTEAEINRLYAEIDAEFGAGAVKRPAEKRKERSLVDENLVKQLVEWMRWPEDEVTLAVEHLANEDKYRLTSNGHRLKPLLLTCSRELGMDCSRGCNRRFIADLLGLVMERLG